MTAVEKEQQFALAFASTSVQEKSLQTISNLPTDVLEAIFAHCASWLFGERKPRHRLAWTQVCKIWRNVSLESPRLWHCIDISEAHLAKESLVRSRAAPLFVITSTPLLRYVDDLGVYADRLESMDIYLFPDDMADVFSSFGPAMPNLHTLSLRIPPVSSSFRLAPIDLSSVRRLSLDGISVPWEACTDLTSLTIRKLNAKFSPTISELRTALERSPRIQIVRLEGIIISSVTSNEPSPSSIRLDCLREMVLSADTRTVTSIMEIVLLSPHSHLQIYCPCINNLNLLFPNGLPYSKLAKSEVSGLRISTQGISLLRSEAETWTDDPIRILVSIFSGKPIQAMTFVHQFFELSQITCVELDIGVLKACSVACLDDFFTRTYNVLKLRLAFNPLDVLLSVLSTPNHLCPRLRTISFYNSPWLFSEQQLKSVADCISKRTSQASTLDTIEFVTTQGIVEYPLWKLLPHVRVVESLGL